MMKGASSIVFTALAILSIGFAEAQHLPKDSVEHHRTVFTDSFNQKFTVVNPSLIYRSFVLPAFLIAYGFTTLNSDGLTDLNENIKSFRLAHHPDKKMHLDNYLQFAPAVAVYGLNIAGIKGKNNLLNRSAIYLVSNVILNVTVSSLKKITHIQRPDESSYESFPSGHTAEAFASAEFLRQEYKGLSPWYSIAGYAAASATGILRMYNNKHWLSDVVAGAGIGIASTRLAYWIYPAVKRRFFRHKEMHTFIMPYYLGNSGGLTMTYTFHK